MIWVHLLLCGQRIYFTLYHITHSTSFLAVTWYFVKNNASVATTSNWLNECRHFLAACLYIFFLLCLYGKQVFRSFSLLLVKCGKIDYRHICIKTKSQILYELSKLFIKICCFIFIVSSLCDSEWADIMSCPSQSNEWEWIIEKKEREIELRPIITLQFSSLTILVKLKSDGNSQKESWC